MIKITGLMPVLIMLVSCLNVYDNSQNDHILRGKLLAKEGTPVTLYTLGWKEGLLAGNNSLDTAYRYFENGRQYISIISGDPFEELLSTLIENDNGTFSINIMSRSTSVTLFFLHNDKIVCHEIPDITKVVQPIEVFINEGCAPTEGRLIQYDGNIVTVDLEDIQGRTTDYRAD